MVDSKFIIDKESDEVAYSDGPHVYIEKKTGLKCISVTTLIEHYVTPFDEVFWSQTKALESLVGVDKFKPTKTKLMACKKFDIKILQDFDISEEVFLNKKQEILQEWKTKNVEACERGTKIHKDHENRILGGEYTEVKRYNLGGKFNCYTNNKLKIGDKGVYPELLLSRVSDDGVLRLAGQADLVIIDEKDVYVCDFKTNKSIDKNSFFDSARKQRQKMQFPLNNILDSNYWHYTIQLSTYAWMIQKIDPTLNIKGLMLIHYDHNNKETIHELEYLKDDVERMLAHYKGNLKKNSEKDKIKPIIY